VTFDTQGNSLYVVNYANNRIDKFNAQTGGYVGSIGKTSGSTGTCPVGTTTGWCTGGTFASGGQDGSINFPQYIAVDSSNQNIYLPDTTAHRITKWR
jgi:DNA-binding beta-propeller fold protein YncE